MIDYTNLKKALKNLELQYNNYLNLDSREYLTTLDKEALEESLIKRFRLLYDIIRDILHKYMKLTDISNQFENHQQIFEKAIHNNIISNNWCEYINTRNNIVMEYFNNKQFDLFGNTIKNFINDADNFNNKITSIKCI